MNSKSVSGTIIEVMESWPLELQIRNKTDVMQTVALAESCHISMHGDSCNTNQLIPGVEVKIQLSAENAAVAVEIQIF